MVHEKMIYLSHEIKSGIKKDKIWYSSIQMNIMMLQVNDVELRVMWRSLLTNLYVSLLIVVKNYPVQDTNKNDIHENTCECSFSWAQLPHTVTYTHKFQIGNCYELCYIAINDAWDKESSPSPTTYCSKQET